MTRQLHQALWDAPGADSPPARVWRDWVVFGAMIVGTLVEGSVRSDLEWRVASIVLGIGLAFTLLWRRTHPLAMVLIAFGATAPFELASIAMDVEWEGLGTSAFVLLLPYALFRWGTAPEAAIGFAVIMASVGFTLLGSGALVSELVGGLIVLWLTCALGAIARYEKGSKIRDVEQIKLVEREQLARELHDTVAHHVSAIAVQAQAGRTLAPTRPEAALEALGVIEEEASRTLEEMRAIVDALRRANEPDLAPQPGVADIEGLGLATAGAPRVEVNLRGDLDHLNPTLDTTVYRLAQESITNAFRHASRATVVTVDVVGEPACVKLTVTDDGAQVGSVAGTRAGYGLVGMAERAELIGGRLRAGPGAGRGWTVTAVLPRRVGSK